MRLYLDEGMAIQAMLARAAEAKEVSQYATVLLAALDSEAWGDKVNASLQQPSRTGIQQIPHPEYANSAPVEALTEREGELLRLIAEGLSNQEIAQRLFISLPTVKWHTSNIYSKLGVGSRTQAVAQARSLGLI